MIYEDVVKLARALPGVEESTSYGTPACKLGGKLVCRLKEDGETLVLRCDYETRRSLHAERPETFFFTEHYRFTPWILIALPKIKPAKLRALLIAAVDGVRSEPPSRGKKRSRS
jgi:hypothetical protein